MPASRHPRVQTLDDFALHASTWAAVIGCRELTAADVECDNCIVPDYYAIVLCTAGSCRFEYDGQEFRVAQHTFSVRRPLVPTRVREVSADFRAVMLAVEPGFYERTMEMGWQTDPDDSPSDSAFHLYSLTPVRARRLMEFYVQVRDVVRHDHYHKDEMVSHLLYVLRLIIAELDSHRTPITHDRGHKENIYRIFVYAVRRHFREHRQLKFYADQQNITTTYLSRVVKERTGNTVYDYITALLFQEICKLLSTTDMPISEIAFSLHFSDQSALTNFFKQRSGLSPKEYRALPRQQG